MARFFVATVFLALALGGQGRSVPTAAAKAKATALIHETKITPPLKDVASDKKFFGPPFPADYPEDERPVVRKSILDKLKGKDQPYPALQSKADFDKDYVKDENSDSGTWKAQFEYDALRRKLTQQEAKEKAAENRANKEGGDLGDAQGKADKAAKDAADAMKDADKAARGENDDDKADDAGAAPSAEALEKLKKKVADAEANYEKEKKDFEECKRQLAESKKILEDLKAKTAETEAKLAGETKLWEERKAVRLNLHKLSVEEAHKVRDIKLKLAHERLDAAQKHKSDMDAVLALKKFKSDQAQKKMHEQKAKMEKYMQNFQAATLRLQKIRGYSPADTKPMKSAAGYHVASLSLLAVIAAACF